MSWQCATCGMFVALESLRRRAVGGAERYVCAPCGDRLDGERTLQTVDAYARIEYECGRCGAGYRGDEGHVCPKRGEG